MSSIKNKEEVINFFLNQIKYDKEYATEMISHNVTWYAVADMLHRGLNVFNYDSLNESSWTECLDFINGNGFICKKYKEYYVMVKLE